MKTFTEKQLVEFGNFLLSKERQKSFTKASKNGVPKSERLKSVTDSDFTNWLALAK